MSVFEDSGEFISVVTAIILIAIVILIGGHLVAEFSRIAHALEILAGVP
jgi:Flp pilus assembly pilin Flp